MQVISTELPTFGWTKPSDIARLHADPSGVQEASNFLQALLFPGMSTQTLRLRYISLFTAAKYYRMQAGKEVESKLNLIEFRRRFEALIAVSSVIHHSDEGSIPIGIVGRGAGDQMSRQDPVTLRIQLQNPPYRIYRGTLANLNLIDTSDDSDPLYDNAKALGTAWDVAQAGALGQQIKTGIIQEAVSKDQVAQAARAFCLCTIPDGSQEQSELIRLLFVIDRNISLAEFKPLSGNPITCRAVSWRFLLKLVELSPNQKLQGAAFMARLLCPDLLETPLPPRLRACLFAWRWVAARTFFERGWSLLFKSTLQEVDRKLAQAPTELQSAMEAGYEDLPQNKSIASLVREAMDYFEQPDWLMNRYAGTSARDKLLCLCAGIYAAHADLKKGPEFLSNCWEDRAIPLATEYQRMEQSSEQNRKASQVWAELAQETLIQHVHISLRKMRDANPDSLLVDFDEGRWVIPAKAQGVDPIPATGGSRLDIALGWAQQLGLVRPIDEGLQLTPLGKQVCDAWDKEHAE